ncbi:MAG TPA: hypothetical protein VN577_16275 [Terriglobales bacterium]|nr:hypothetical protein [Terriglobales bacterium]
MSRMIELIRQSAVPATVMRSAARGALSLPAGEMVEILVYLSHNPTFSDQARLSLAGFDLESMKQVASDAKTPVEVFEYLGVPENVRPAILPILLDNPALPHHVLLQLALSHSQEILSVMAGNKRVQADLPVLRTLFSNHALPLDAKAQIEPLLNASDHAGKDSEYSEEDLLEIEGDIARYLTEHATEIAAEEAKGFELIDLTEEEKHELVAHKEKEHASAEDRKRMSPLQKIASMTVGERVQLAMKGNREERYILIRDGCKVVSSAVLECPKLTDQEAETFAAMKNVQETVLRGIAGKRKFMKLYPVVRALSSNPRCPLDVALPMLKNLLVQDLRNLSMNKNVSDTLRKVSFKMFKEKSSTKKDQ